MNVDTAEPAIQTPPQMDPEPNTTAPIHLRRLVLTGFMGAGKTTVGRILSQRLGWDFLDLDIYIEARTGKSVPAIFEQHGERHFRKLESQALASALGKIDIVLALGGGVPEILTNRLLLEQTPETATIFLNAPFGVLLGRCMLQATDSAATDRPNLADSEAAEARFKERQPLYRRLAHHTIETEALSTEQTVTELLARLDAGSPKPR